MSTIHSASNLVPGIAALAAAFALTTVIRNTTGAVRPHRPVDFRLLAYTLDNGLEVILVEDHSAPAVAVSVWYRVGGANDPEGRSGFAHLFEHMMFQGSANVARGQHAALINAAGGDYNASTGIDRTNYFESLPAHQLPLALWLEADRLRSLTVDRANFEREVEVVKEEYRQRIENQPYGEALLKLQTMAHDYPPYQRPTIGSLQDLEAATVEEVREFHAHFYKPNNAVLTIAGDIDIEQARELVQRYLGDIQRQPPPPELPPYTFTPQQEAQEVLIHDRLARVPALFIAYRLPARSSRDYYAADLLARILGGGHSSRLARALIDTGLATTASSAVSGNLGPSQFTAILIPNPDVGLERLEGLYYGELERILQEGVSAAELEKAVNQIHAEKVRNFQRAFGLAESVQAANFYLRDPRAAFTEIDRYRSITPAAVREAARAYLTGDRRNVIQVVPAGGRGSAAAPPGQGPAAPMAPVGGNTAAYCDDTELSRASAGPFPHPSPPSPLPLRELALPVMSEATLDNGLHVIVVPIHDLPLLTVLLAMPGGESAAPAEKAGLADITAELLLRGTASRSAQDIARTIEQIGGQLTAFATRDEIGVLANVLSKDADIAFDLMGDIARNSTFPENEWENQRQQALTTLQAMLANPGVVADRALNALVYGSHPYGQASTIESIRCLTRQDTIDYYRAQFRPQAGLLVIVGDVAREEAVRKAGSAFGAWSISPAVGDTPFAAPPGRPGLTVYLVDRPGSTQCNIALGHLGIRGDDPHRYAVQVMNQVLGGGSTSRLFQNLREEKGYTYGIVSQFTFPRDRGRFAVRAAVRNEVAGAALRAILTELHRLRQDRIPQDELTRAKSYLQGSYVLDLETTQALARRISDLKLRGLPLDTLRVYPRAIGEIDRQEVHEAAQRYVHPEQAAAVVVGDAAAIRSQLAEVAPIVMVDESGAPTHADG